MQSIHGLSLAIEQHQTRTKIIKLNQMVNFHTLAFCEAGVENQNKTTTHYVTWSLFRQNYLTQHDRLQSIGLCWDWVLLPNLIKRNLMDWVWLGLIYFTEFDWFKNWTCPTFGPWIDFDWVWFQNIRLTLPGESPCLGIVNAWGKN